MGIEGAMVLLVVVLSFGTIIGLIFWWAIRSGARAVENLTAVAGRTGLGLRERRFLRWVTGGELHGTVQGRAVRLWTYTTGSGKSQKTWVAAGVRPRAHGGLTFRLSRQGAMTKVMEFFGVKEITVGDPAFDAAWFVQTNQPDFLRAALVPDVRARLLEAAGRAPDCEFALRDGEVVYAEQGGFANAKQCDRVESALPVLRDLADVAEVYASTRGEGRPA